MTIFQGECLILMYLPTFPAALQILSSSLFLCARNHCIYTGIYGDDPSKWNSTFLPFNMSYYNYKLSHSWSLLAFKTTIFPWTQSVDDCDLKHLDIKLCHFCTENDAHSWYAKLFSKFYTDSDILFHFCPRQRVLYLLGLFNKVMYSSRHPSMPILIHWQLLQCMEWWEEKNSLHIKYSCTCQVWRQKSSKIQITRAIL